MSSIVMDESEPPFRRVKNVAYMACRERRVDRRGSTFNARSGFTCAQAGWIEHGASEDE